MARQPARTRRLPLTLMRIEAVPISTWQLARTYVELICERSDYREEKYRAICSSKSGNSENPMPEKLIQFIMQSNEFLPHSHDKDDILRSPQSQRFPLRRSHRTVLRCVRSNVNILSQVTALLGKTAYLNCRVKNLGNKTVSIWGRRLKMWIKKQQKAQHFPTFRIPARCRLRHLYFAIFSIIYAHA